MPGRHIDAALRHGAFLTWLVALLRRLPGIWWAVLAHPRVQVFAEQRAVALVVVVAGLLLGALMLITIGVSSGLLAG